MADKKLEALIDELREDGREDEAEHLEKLSGSNLRKKAQDAEKIEKERDDLKERLEKLEAAPKRTKAFEDFGIDLDELSKAERRVIDQYDGELDEEALGKLVEEYDLPLAEDEGDGKDEEPAAAKVTKAARKAPEGRANKAPSISPEDAAKWSPDKWMKFKQEHPEEAEQIKQNETVTGITFT